jgi:predicted phage-related endonuclease
VIATADLPFDRHSFEERVQWLAARVPVIGASDSAMIVLGKGRRVYDAKVNGVEVESTQQMRMGILIEPTIRQACREFFGWDLDDPLPNELCVSRRVPFLAFSPDSWRHVGKPRRRPVQLKNVGPWSPDWKTLEADEIPAYMYAQVQQEIEVSGADAGELVCLLGGCELKRFEIERNDDYIEGLVDMLTDWRQRYLIDREPHPVDAEESTAKAIATAAKYERRTRVYLEGPAAEAATGLPELKKQHADIEEQIRRRENEIRQAMQYHNSAIAPDGREYYWTRGENRQFRSKG